MNIGAFAWGVFLFIPLSGIVAAVYLALALARRGSVATAPVVAQTGWPPGMRLTLIVVGSLLVILVVVSAIVLLSAGGMAVSTQP